MAIILPVQGRDYDIAAPGIRCNADKDGTRVFDAWNDRIPLRLRVLAHSEEEAQEAAGNYEPEAVQP